MTKKGTLHVSMGVSRLDAIRLARQGASNPFGAATSFLANRGLGDDDFIWVEGSDGFVGNVPVIFITDAGKASDESSVSATPKSVKKKAKNGVAKTAKPKRPKT